MARILLIEDNAALRAMLAKHIALAGHTVSQAGDGREGLSIFRRAGADLVVTDLVMPETEGLGVLNLILGRKDYPPPPTSLIASRDVETLWYRYRGHLEGKEPLPAVAFFCLTLVEALALGNRRKAARLLGMEFTVLDTLGRLVTNKGDAETIRKFPVSRVLTALSAQEESWIRDVVRALIRQAGAHAAGVTPKPLTMADFPPLPGAQEAVSTRSR